MAIRALLRRRSTPGPSVPTATAPRPGWTVRRRLLFGLLVVLGVLSAGVAGADVLTLRHVLYQRSAQGLRTEVDILAASTASPLPSPTARSPAGSPSCSAITSVSPSGLLGAPPGPGARLGPGGVQRLTQVLATRGVATAVLGPRGHILACDTAAGTGHGASFGVPAAAAALLAGAGAGGYVTLHAGGRHLLAMAQPLGPDTAIVVTDLGGDDAAVDVVLLVTVLGALASILVAAVLGRPLIASGLAPLAKVADTADAIASGDLDRRAGLPHSADEVGRLGTAFDAMVDRLQGTLAERDHLVRELQAREQTMRRFLADASHELRTPLTAIRGGAQVLLLGSASDPEELAEALGHIHSQAGRMSRLVADLLLLSRREGVEEQAPRELVDLGALIAGEQVQWEALCPGRAVTTWTSRAWIAGNRDAIVRLAASLVENAANYSPAPSPIEIRVWPTGGRARLVVTDHGPGIPAEERTKVFERFYRGDPARARTTGGSGLGLAIVAGIAADHDGECWVDQTPGGGATLVVTIPLARDAPA